MTDQTTDQLRTSAVEDFLIRQPLILTLNNTPFLNTLNKMGRIVRKDLSKGTKIYVTSDDGEGAYTGTDGKINSESKSKPFNAMWTKKTMSRIVKFDRDSVVYHESPNIIIDNIRTAFSESAGTLISTIENSLYGSEIDDDGKSLSGLTDAISKTPTTGIYAGVDRSINTMFRNQAIKATAEGQAGVDPSVFDGKPTTPDNILDRISACITLLEYNGTYNDRFILTSSDYYGMIERALNKTGRNEYKEKGSLYYSADSLYIRGIKVINAGGIQFVKGVNHPGIDPKTLYILSANTLELGYMNTNISTLKNIAKSSGAYKGEEIGLDNKLMLFNVSGLERGGSWLMREINNIHPSAQLLTDLIFTCSNPALNLVMYD